MKTKTGNLPAPASAPLRDRSESREETTWSVGWLELLAGTTCVIGIAALLLLMTESARAAPARQPAQNTGQPRGGFQPGGRPFNNPFANNQGGGYFDDDNAEDDDFGEDFGQMPANQGGWGQPPGNPPQAGGGQGAPQHSGGRPAQADRSAPVEGSSQPVISHNRTAPLSVNDETGEGTCSREHIDFNFPDIDIVDLAKSVGKMFGKNFILDKDVKGKVTIISNAKISACDAWKAFLTALDINGFALIPSGTHIRIARQRDARDKQLPTYTGDKSPDTDALITRVFPLKYISAEEVARTFRSFMPANSRIIPYEQTNTVIVTDTGSNISKLAKMLEILDIEGYDAGIEVIPVKFASAAELSKLIDTLIPGTGASAGGQPGVPRFGGGAGGRFSARRTKEGGIINSIIADERTNTLIVHANSRGADQVRELVAKLDQKVPAQAGGGKVHVVYLQFADAESVATTLNTLSSQVGGGFRSTTGGAGGTGTNPVAANLFEGSIKVAPDKATNSLVVTASPADFVTLQRVINKIDIPRDEVYVETVIMEVSLGKEFNFSANVINPASGLALTTNADLFKFIADPTSQQGAILGFASGRERSFTVGSNTFKVNSVNALIKAIQTNTNSNVLATPQIIALDNAEATFESAEKIPVPTVTQVQGVGAATGVTRESIALSVKIKPQINKLSNFVKLDVEAKLADISGRVLPQQVANLAFATLERNAKTTVVVADSDTVVIGGLMRDKVEDQVSKIPILGDIPLLGWLFRSKSSKTEKTNLLMFMTPHIVRQYEKVRAILDRKLKERDDYLERNAGGQDNHRYERDRIIRSLPDMKELLSKKHGNSASADHNDAMEGEEANPFSGGRAPPNNETIQGSGAFGSGGYGLGGSPSAGPSTGGAGGGVMPAPPAEMAPPATAPQMAVPDGQPQGAFEAPPGGAMMPNAAPMIDPGLGTP